LTEIVIENGLLITLDKDRRIIRNGAIAVEDDTIVAVGKTDEIKGNTIELKR